jgi:hypothetical protein
MVVPIVPPEPAIIDGGAKQKAKRRYSPRRKSPTKRSYRSRSSRSLRVRNYFPRSGFNTLPVKHNFTAELKREIKRLQSDTSKRGKFIWQTIEDDIHNIKNMKDLKSWVKSGSELYAS